MTWSEDRNKITLFLMVSVALVN